MTPSAVPTYETGVFLGLNAIENAALIMNSPRCSFVRGLKVFMHHDVHSTVYRSDGRHRLITTEWSRYEDVGGNEEDFARMLEEFTGKIEAEWVFTTQNISSFVSGFDLEGLTNQAGRASSKPLIPLDGPRLDESFLGGYDEVLAKVLARRLEKSGRRRELLLAGHFLGRNEADEIGNVEELKRLLSGLALPDPVILLSGGNLAIDPLNPKLLATLPYAGRRSSAAVSAAGFEVTKLGLPLGIEATVNFLRNLGSKTGRETTAESFIDRELSALIPEIQWIVSEHLMGRQAVIVAEPHLAQALERFLHELGLRVGAVFELAFAPVGEYTAQVFTNPSPDTFCEFIEQNPPDLVMGNGVFKHLTTGKNPPYLELGFPSYRTHVLHPRPYLGFHGARCLIEAIFNMLILT
jgi:nitrogenase molybdenum-iron protein alpha/beta subunit